MTASNKGIEFRNGEPLRTNRKCEKCLGKCRQHYLVTIQYCPDFEPLKSWKDKMADNLPLGKG